MNWQGGDEDTLYYVERSLSSRLRRFRFRFRYSQSAFDKLSHTGETLSEALRDNMEIRQVGEEPRTRFFSLYIIDIHIKVWVFHGTVGSNAISEETKGESLASSAKARVDSRQRPWGTTLRIIGWEREISLCVLAFSISLELLSLFLGKCIPSRNAQILGITAPGLCLSLSLFLFLICRSEIESHYDYAPRDPIDFLARTMRVNNKCAPPAPERE